MVNIKPIETSELKEIVKEVRIGDPVYLSEDSKVKCVLVDAQDYQRLLTALKLINQLG